MNKTDIELGRVNTLRIRRKVDFGYYLEGYIRGTRTDILLPNNEIKGNIFQYIRTDYNGNEVPTPQEHNGLNTDYNEVPANQEHNNIGTTHNETPVLQKQNYLKTSGNEAHVNQKQNYLKTSGNEAPPLRGGGGEVGSWIDVFIYLDQDEKLIATTETPLAQVGDFAYLEVAWVNNFGAFLHWGLMKDLFVPFREQKMKMVKGNSYIVHVHLDEDSYRIMASAKVDRYLDGSFPPYKTGDEVDVLVWQKTELGLKVIVDNRFGGLLYDDQVFRNLRTGDRTKAYVSQVRRDGKIDLMLSRTGQAAVHDFSDTLLQYIKDNGGKTVLCDKSPAEDIYEVFGVSKKVFKKAVGDLYKKRLISIEPDGIKLA